MIHNVIFDVGNVLVEWDCNFAFRELAFDEETCRAVAEATVQSSEWNEYDRSALSDDEQLAVFIRRAPLYEKQIRLFWEHIGLTIKQYDYTREWIRGLKRSGYHVYILSNYAAWTYEQTREELSFLEDVDGAVFSFQVKKVKPEPEIYQILLEKYNLNPAECIFIDDRRDNIEAAEAQGICGIPFVSYEQAARMLADYGVGSGPQQKVKV